MPLWIFTVPGLLFLIVGLQIMEMPLAVQVPVILVYLAWAAWAVRTAQPVDPGPE